MVVGYDPVATGMISSFAHPGGRVTPRISRLVKQTPCRKGLEPVNPKRQLATGA
jgi:hypothetical protein